MTSMIAVPLTFAPAGESVRPRCKRSRRDSREGGDAHAPAFPRGNTKSDRSACVRFRLRQVFGLVDVQLAPTVRRFPDAWRPVHVTEFVSTYRCGAAPDSHRLPFMSSLHSDEEMTTISVTESSRTDALSQTTGNATSEGCLGVSGDGMSRVLPGCPTFKPPGVGQRRGRRNSRGSGVAVRWRSLRG